MKMPAVMPGYPENVYCMIFGELEYPDMPPDAEDTLGHVIATTLSRLEAEIFLLSYKEKLSFANIGEKYDVTKESIRQIVYVAERKLRFANRNNIITMGKEAYLKSVIEANERKQKTYYERIAELKAMIRKQLDEITGCLAKVDELDRQARTQLPQALYSSIDCLGLSVRSWNCLIDSGIHTVKSIVDFGDLSRIRNMGQRSVQEVREKTAAYLSEQGCGDSYLRSYRTA